MKNFGQEIKALREQAKLPLRTVASFLDIDQAILSKIENGKRNASKEQVTKLAVYFNTDEKTLIVNYLADKIVKELKYEPYNKEVLMVAEEKLTYGNALILNQQTILDQLKKFFVNEARVVAAYLFGSVARNEGKNNSDVDVMVELSATKKHTMFDLLDIQYRLSQFLNRKVDIVEKGFLKPHAAQTVSKDLKLIIQK